MSQIPDPNKPSLLLLAEDDVLGDLFYPLSAGPVAVGYLDPGGDLPRQVFSSQALQESVQRLSALHGAVPLEQGLAVADVRSAASDVAAEQILMMRPAVGAMRDLTDPLSATLQHDRLTLCLMTRAWDQHLFPYATAGFFRFKKQIPHVLGTLT